MKRQALSRICTAEMLIYTHKVESITDSPFSLPASRFAESVCPSIRRHRRRAVACARLARRLSPR